MRRRVTAVIAAAVMTMGVMGLANAGEEIAGAGGLYVADDGLWQESNNVDGLQRSASGNTAADTKLP